MTWDTASIENERKKTSEREKKRKAELARSIKAYNNYTKMKQLEKDASDKYKIYNDLLSDYNTAAPEQKGEIYNKLTAARNDYLNTYSSYKDSITANSKTISAATGDTDTWAKNFEKQYKKDIEQYNGVDDTAENDVDTAPSEGATDNTTAKNAAGAISNLVSNSLIEGSNAPDKSDAHLRNQAQIHDKQAALEGANAAKESQIANRDYRGEADKNAAATAATKNAQNVANLGAAAGNATAALARTVETPDYNTHMNRQDETRQRAVANQREAEGAKQTAERERAAADTTQNRAQNMQTFNNTATNLSRGSTIEPDTAITGNAESTTNPEDTTQQKANMQSLLNYVIYANDSTSSNSQKYIDTFNNSDELKALAVKYGMQPLTAEEINQIGADNNQALSEYVFNKYATFGSDYNSLTGRNVGTDKQKNVGDDGYTQEQLNKDAMTNLNSNITNAVNERR